jgi:hypothetical protein
MPMPPPVVSPLKRKSLDDLPEYSSKRQALASPGEVSPRGFPLGPNMQLASGAQPVNIQPRPNGYVSSVPAPNPSISASPYNPAPTGRRRGRPPKVDKATWHVSTYPPIAPSTAPAPTPAPQPNSPGLHVHSPHQPPAQGLPDPKLRKKALPEIAPRPTQGMPGIEPAARSPAVPGAEYQSWRDETTRREYYQVQAAEPQARDRPPSVYASILPRPRSPRPRSPLRSPLPPPRELARPPSTEPRRFTTTPPTSTSEPAKKEGQAAAKDPVKT